MQEYNIKYKNSTVLIRKVKLVSIHDKKYLKYEKDWTSYKSRKYPKDKKELDIDTKNCINISFSLENIIRKWVGSSDNRILCWEEFDGCVWRRQYTEMDFVTELGNNNIIVGEIKTQLINNQQYKNNMNNQFERRKSFLDCTDLKYNFVGITALVDKSDGYLTKGNIFTPTTLHDFNDDFFKNEKIVESNISKIKLSAEKLIDYGIRNNIIDNDDLLKDVYLWIDKNK